MITIKAKEIKGLKDGTISTAAYADNLVATYPAKEIALALAEFISMNDVVKETPKIAVTADELNAIVAMFRIKGDSPRGRKPKEK